MHTLLRLTGRELKDYLYFQSPGNKRINTENRHQHPLVQDMRYTDGVNMLYTDGVKLFAEEGGQEGAYWFLDLVALKIQFMLLQLQIDPDNGDFKDAPDFYVELLVQDRGVTLSGDGALRDTRLSNAILYVFVYEEIYHEGEGHWETGHWETYRKILNEVPITYTDIQPGEWNFVVANNVLMLPGEFESRSQCCNGNRSCTSCFQSKAAMPRSRPTTAMAVC